MAVSLCAGGASSAVGFRLGVAEGALIGIAVAGLTFVVLGWAVLWRLDQPQTQALTITEDPSRTLEEGLVVGVALASLGGIAAFIVAGSSAPTWTAGLAVLGVASAWGSLHLMYATRYAKLYYTNDGDDAFRKGIDFGEHELPAYRDFLYFSYNLGMTYQVSDTSVSRTEIRQVVLFHCLLSYAFGTAILATTINLVLGVLSV